VNRLAARGCRVVGLDNDPVALERAREDANATGATADYVESDLRQLPFELVDAIAWVVLDTSFAEGGVAHTAARRIAATVRRDHHDELAARLDGWIDDLRGRAERGEFLFSVNDYSALLRNPPR